MKESTKRNIIDGSILVTTTVGGIFGVVTGIPVIQVAAYLPPIVQAVFLKKLGIENKIDEDLNEDLKKLILSTCKITKKQLQKKSSSIADFFGYACARIESELKKNFSIENIGVFFKECIEQDANCEGVYLSEEDLQDLINIFVNTFIENLPKCSKLADYLLTLAIVNLDQRIQNLEKGNDNSTDEARDILRKYINNIKNCRECKGELDAQENEAIIAKVAAAIFFYSTDEVRKISRKYFNIIKNRGRFKGYSDVQESEEVITEITDSIFMQNIGGSIEKTLEEIVFPEDHKWGDSISLCGKGGSGKTYQILRLIEIILDEKNRIYHGIIPFYLELNDIKNNYEEAVLCSISKEHDLNINELKNILKTHANRCIIFADGLNEITDRNIRSCVINDICNIREKYNTRVVLSSRDDHSRQFNGRNRGANQKFTAAKVCDLKPSQINNYFEICLEDFNITLLYSEIKPLTQRLLCNAQGYVYGIIQKQNKKGQL